MTEVAPAGAAPTAAAVASDASAAIANDPSAERLCDVLHGLPARRRSECCGGTQQRSLAALCATELSSAVRSGSITIETGALDRCAAEASLRLEGCGWVRRLPPKRPASCSSVLQGKLALGGSCRSSLECADGLYCRGAAPGSSGFCTSPAPAHSRCAVPADNLAAFTGLAGDPRHAECRGRCIRGQCLPFASAGASCTSSAICLPGLECIAGRCAEHALPEVGESCAGNTACGDGAYCDQGRCQAIKGAGESCVRPFECGSLACVKAAGSEIGACADACASSAPVTPGERM